MKEAIRKRHILSDSTYMRCLVKILRTQSRVLMSGAGGMGNYCFMGTELQFYKVKKFWGCMVVVTVARDQ